MTLNRRLRAEEGQILAGLILVMIALFTFGLWLFQVGNASAKRADAQTGADAAALAAAEEMKRQLFSFDVPNPALINWVLVRAEAEKYAARNDVSITGFTPLGLDVIVEATNDEGLRADGADDLGVEGDRGRAKARARVAIIQVPWASAGGTGTSQSIPPPADAPEFVRRAWAEADRIDSMGLPYLWGGGHQSSPAPPNGPFDCSGSVSRVLQAAGLPIPTMVSGQFMGVGQPGADPSGGGVNIYANDGHVYMSINGRFFGTSGQNPGGGAGWLENYGAQAGFVVRHIPLDGDFVNIDLANLTGGASFSPAAFAARYEVILVPLDGRGGTGVPSGQVDGEGLGDPNDPRTWQALAQCESSGDPTAVNPSSGAGGLYQFLPSTWASVGGRGLPQDAPAEEQLMRAKMLYEREGWGQWVCAQNMGWSTADPTP